MRKPIIAGNWKMHMLQGEAQELLNGLCDLGKASGIAKDKLPEVVVAPVFTSLNVVNNGTITITDTSFVNQQLELFKKTGQIALTITDNDITVTLTADLTLYAKSVKDFLRILDFCPQALSVNVSPFSVNGCANEKKWSCQRVQSRTPAHRDQGYSPPQNGRGPMQE